MKQNKALLLTNWIWTYRCFYSPENSQIKISANFSTKKKYEMFHVKEQSWKYLERLPARMIKDEFLRIKTFSFEFPNVKNWQQSHTL